VVDRTKNKQKEKQVEIVEDFKRLLEDENPENISLGWINKTDKNLYQRIVRYFSRKDEGVDWNKFRSELPLLWRSKWTPIVKVEKYRNKEELESVLSNYKDEMYVLFMNGKKEMEKGEEIWTDLIRLAQKGNNDAYDVVYKLAGGVVDDYIKNKEDPDDNSLYIELDKDTKEKVIERCIRLYSSDIEGYFKNYLLKSIGFHLKKRGYKYSIDNEPEEGTSLHERLASEVDVGDSEDVDDIVFN